jgi:hypothetical protein
VAETYENGGFCAPERKGALTQCLWNIAPPLLPEGGAFIWSQDRASAMFGQ